MLQLCRCPIAHLLHARTGPDNVPTNQEALLSRLNGFVDRTNELLRSAEFRVAEMMVRAKASVPHAQSVSSGFHGDPDDARAAALVCADA